MIDDDDFEDLGEGVHDEDEVSMDAPIHDEPGSGTNPPNQPHGTQPPSQSAAEAGADLSTMSTSLPSENELQLNRRVLELEQERDALATEVKLLRHRYPTDSAIAPVPTTEAPTPSSPPIVIPNELLPTLTILRDHISELARDNAALRYTFIGSSIPATTALPSAINSTSSSSKATLDTPLAPPTASVPSPAPVVTALVGGNVISPPRTTQFMSPQMQDGGMTLPVGLSAAPRVDLDAVVERVRTLIRENEELGEMLLQVGRGSGEEWAKALEDSKAVITSLDADLSHHLGVIEAQRAELEKYRAAYGPVNRILPSTSGSTASASGPSSARHTPSSDQYPRNDRAGGADRRPRGGGNSDRDRSRAGMGTTGGARDGRGHSGRNGGGGGGGGGGERREGREGQGKERAGSGTPTGMRNDHSRAGSTGSGAGGQRGGAVGNDSSSRRAEEDRASKRRR